MSEPWKSSSFWLPASPANDNIARLRPESLTTLKLAFLPSKANGNAPLRVFVDLKYV